MNDRSTPPLPLALLCTAAVVAPASAQTYSPGDVVVGVEIQGASPPFQLRVVEPSGNAFPLTGFAPTPVATCFDVDPMTGDIVHALGGVNGVELWRARIIGQAVVQNTMITTIGNAAEVPVYLHREESGGFLVLVHTPPIGQQKIYRVGVSTGGAIAYTLQTLPAQPSFVSLGADSSMWIFLASPTANPTVQEMPYGGGAPQTAAFTGIQAWAVEANSQGTPIFGGDPYTIPLLTTYNWACFWSTQLLGNGSPGAYQSVRDLELNLANNQMFATLNYNGPSIVERWDYNNCAISNRIQLHTAAPNEFLHKVSVYDEDTRFGFARETTQAIPLATTTVAPTLGGSWDNELRVSVTTALPGAIFVMGFSDTASGGTPLPLDWGPLGYPRTAQWVSADATVFVAISNGRASWSWPIPNDPSLSQLKLFGQWTAVEGSTVVHSNALVAIVP